MKPLKENSASTLAVMAVLNTRLPNSDMSSSGAGQPLLAADKDESHGEAKGDEPKATAPGAVGGQFLDAVHHGHHGQQGQGDAGHVHPSRAWVLRLRDEERGRRPAAAA